MTGFEIIEWDHHFFTSNQFLKMVIDQFQIQGEWCFKIVISKLILRVHFEIKEVIINIKGYQFQPG